MGSESYRGSGSRTRSVRWPETVRDLRAKRISGDRDGVTVAKAETKLEAVVGQAEGKRGSRRRKGRRGSGKCREG